jgi:hypothetical protein
MSYKVVYNAKYGGFELSKEGLAEYNKRTSKNIEYGDGIHRDDPILIKLVESMGNQINGKCSKLKIREFPIKYKSFLTWDEYDGYESVCIDYAKYLIYKIKCVKNNTSLTSDEKLSQIDQLYQEYDERPKTILDKEDPENEPWIN